MDSEPRQTEPFPPGDPSTILRPGETCWRIEQADRFAMVIDAADYFRAVRSAMLEAEETILLIGWDFDLRIDLLPGGDDGAPTRLGDFLKYLVKRKPHLRIRILKWDMSVLYSVGSQIVPMLALDLRAVSRIKLRFDSKHPWTAAHHQKIVVIDDSIAFCGGIDMTVDRWDTRGHCPGDPRRRRPAGSPSGPWHDSSTAVDGAAARALGDLARDRWRTATGERLRVPARRREVWPDCLSPDLRDVRVGISRTAPAYEGRAAVNEIEALYLAAIRAARRTIYLESQYFASNSICEALAERLSEPDGPEVVVVNPLTTIGWLEQHTMDVARTLRLKRIGEADRHGRFGIFHPVTAAREPIYVHSKVLIVDDGFLRVGSSNVNNRSMGFDTECDLSLEARTGEERRTILRYRDDLLSEHLGVEIGRLRDTIRETGSLLGAVEALRNRDGRSLLPIRQGEVSGAEETVARAHLADPEEPQQPETRLKHLAKRIALRVPPSAWVVMGTAGVAGVLAVRRAQRRREARRRRCAHVQRLPRD